MDYASFNKYRRSLPKHLLALDDLNPYPLLSRVASISSTNSFTISNAGDFLCTASGVREILKIQFKHFSDNGYSIILPSDSYPVYFQLPPVNANVLVYHSYNSQHWRLPDIDNAIALVTNPMAAQGSYLAASVLEQLDFWLCQRQQRWLIVDQVYDYFNKCRDFRFNSNNVIYVGSLSKLALKPGDYGWATSRNKFNGGNKTNSAGTVSTHAEFLSAHYAKAWKKLTPQLLAMCENWQAPEIGYLSIMPLPQQALLQHNVAAIPISVFGVRANDACVVSCLSEVKHELFNQ